MTVHLAVLQAVAEEDLSDYCYPQARVLELQTQAAVLYSPARYDFVWNDDFSAFRPVRLLWWDEASYLAYQSGDYGEDEGGGAS